MGNVIEFPNPANAVVETTHYFGGCPICGTNDGQVDLARDHWFICERHKTKWHFGSNLFSARREQTEDDWRRNEYRLANYMTVEPVYSKAGVE